MATINPTTYNDVCNLMRTICLSHLAIKQFTIGTPSDIETATNVNPVQVYPRVHMVPEPAEITGRTIVYSFSFIVMDLAKDTADREQRTHNNTMSILMDILAKLKMTSWDEVDINIQIPLVAVPFVEGAQNSVTGWTAELKIETKNPLNLCEAAFSS